MVGIEIVCPPTSMPAIAALSTRAVTNVGVEADVAFDTSDLIQIDPTMGSQ